MATRERKNLKSTLVPFVLAKFLDASLELAFLVDFALSNVLI